MKLRAMRGLNKGHLHLIVNVWGNQLAYQRFLSSVAQPHTYTFSSDRLAALNMFLSPSAVCSCCCPAGPPPLHRRPVFADPSTSPLFSLVGLAVTAESSGTITTTTTTSVWTPWGHRLQNLPHTYPSKVFPTRPNHHISHVLDIFLLRPLVSPHWTGFKARPLNFPDGRICVVFSRLILSAIPLSQGQSTSTVPCGQVCPLWLHSRG